MIEVYLKKIGHLHFEIVDIDRLVQVLRFDFQKFRISNFELSPMQQ